MTFLEKYGQAIVASLIGFFTPIFSLLMATGTLLLADMITGMYAAKKRGEQIESKKLGRSITKCIFYYLAIILGHVMEVVFINDLPIAKITAGIIATVEFKSNMENIAAITGIDFWKALRDKVDSKRGLDEQKNDTERNC